MEMRLTFVPPGGGEADYEISVDLPAVPQPGDYIKIWRKDMPDQKGSFDFIARRTWWDIKVEENGQTAGEFLVECEYALSGMSAPGHVETCKGYEGAGLKPKCLDDSAF